MLCGACGFGGLYEDGQVADRDALIDFAHALLASDIPLARIMAGRAFRGEDARGVEDLLARAAARRSA